MLTHFIFHDSKCVHTLYFVSFSATISLQAQSDEPNISSPISSLSLRSSFVVDSDVSPISLEDTPCSTGPEIVTSTPNQLVLIKYSLAPLIFELSRIFLLFRRSQQTGTDHDFTTEVDGDGNVIVDVM